MRITITTTIAVLLAMAAATVSHKLLLKHTTGSSGASWFDAGCNEESKDSGADCAAVLASPYSYLPPKWDDEAGGIHVPVALLGMVYYSVLAVWLFGIGTPSYGLRRLHLVPILAVMLGLAGSAYFTFVMFTQLDEWCPWCLVTHGLNVLIAGCLFIMRPRPSSENLPDDSHSVAASSESAPTTSPRGALHPTSRLMALTMVSIGLVLFAEYEIVGKVTVTKIAKNNKTGFDRCLVELDKYRKDTNKLIKSWQKSRKWDISVRADDPARGGSKNPRATLRAIVFSDFECPSCKRLAKFLDEKASPLFAGNLQIIYKHFPLNKDCNPDLPKRMHKHACEAASMAEAARAIGGNDAFWRTHDVLFKKQSRLHSGRLSVANVAEAISLDANAMIEAMKSEDVERRIRQDVADGRFHDVKGTPTIFLAGKRVSSLARRNLGFWKEIADMYWKNRGVPRPASTQSLP